jgi:methionyl-tRNA formyltransferase
MAKNLTTTTLNLNPSKVTLFLMTEKGYFFLKNCYPKYKDLIELVIVSGDSQLKKDYENEIIEFCILHNIQYLKKCDFNSINTEFCIAVSWRWLINHPANSLIVFHDSLLPRYRGFAPLVNSLINGENEIGVTALFGDKNYDTGNIITQCSIKIKYPIKISDAIQLIHKCYHDTGNTIFNLISLNKSIKSIPQDETKATYSIWRDESDYFINWEKSAIEIERFINALGSPYNGALTRLDNKVVRIHACNVMKDIKMENRHCGKTIYLKSGMPVVICGIGLLKITDASIEDNGSHKALIPSNKLRLRFY